MYNTFHSDMRMKMTVVLGDISWLFVVKYKGLQAYLQTLGRQEHVLWARPAINSAVDVPTKSFPLRGLSRREGLSMGPSLFSMPLIIYSSVLSTGAGCPPSGSKEPI